MNLAVPGRTGGNYMLHEMIGASYLMLEWELNWPSKIEVNVPNAPIILGGD